MAYLVTLGDGHGYLLRIAVSEETKQKAKRYNLFSKIALFLICLGFIFQLSANFALPKQTTHKCNNCNCNHCK